MAIVIFAFPKYVWAAKVFYKPGPDEESLELEKEVWPLYLSAHAFAYNKRFGLLFLLGLAVDLVLIKTGIL